MDTRLLAFASLFAATISAPLHAQEVTPEQAAVEGGLVPLVQFRGEAAEAVSIAERMEELGIASASVAVYRDGRLAWARGYGEGIDADTLFQAASLSKSVAATGIVALAMERGVSLDADISGDLAGLDLAQINPEGLPITLRQLLSHTNGAGVGGFPGYAEGEAVPTTAQVIMGAGPTNTDMVVITSERQGTYEYSGGGYTIAQLWAENVSGEPFPAIMQRLVLDPVGMERSLFSAERQGELPRENVAVAYNGDGSPVPGGWNVYPEYAAASLWTTPTEYGLYITAMMRAREGEDGTGLSADVVREVTTVVANDYGLGISVGEIDGAQVLGHSGSNRGYKSNFAAYPATDDLIVTMTGADNGWPLMSDIGRTANLAYGWPMPPLVERDRLSASESELRALSGTYNIDSAPGVTLLVEPGNGVLDLSIPSGPRWSMVRVSNASWIDPDDAQEITFTVGEDGSVSATDGNITIVRQ